MKLRLFLMLSVLMGQLQAQTGISWSPATSVCNMSMYDNRHPRIMLDGSGNPMVLWGNGADKKVVFSRWNGNAFSTPVYLNPANMDVFAAFWAGPDFASSGDTVYAVFKREPETSDTNHIYIVRSFDGGMSFSAPFQVDMIGNNLSRFPTVTVDNTGNPLVAFMKMDANFMNPKWVVARSTDYGSTFAADVLASGYSGGNGDICDCCPGAIVSNSNKVAMLYRDNLNNLRDTWTGISTDGGVTFPNGMNIDQHNWMINACPSSGPDGIIVNDTLYSVMMSAKNGPSMAYFGKASVSGLQAAASTYITGPMAGLNQQNYPRIANYGNAAAEVWKQVVSGGDAQVGFKFTNNIQNGFSSAFDTVAYSNLNDIENADVAVGYGSVHVVWQDENSGTVKYRKGIYTPTGINNQLDEPVFSVYPNPVAGSLYIRNLSPAAMVEISDTFGQLVLKTQSNPVQVDGLSPGVYFLTAGDKGQNFRAKFIKQ